MAPRLRRPEVDAAINICSRTLTDAHSTAVQVAHHRSFQLIHPKSPETIPIWTAELELDILVGFGVDPKHYTIRIHDMTPSDQPCPREQELKTLKDIAIDQIISGPYEVHFILRDGVTAPSTQDLREWQQRWTVAVADPSPAPARHMFTLCNSRNHIASLAVDSLQAPPEGDVEIGIRHRLGLTSSQEIIKHQLGRALNLNVGGREVTFHLNGEACAAQRDISELTTTTLVRSNIVKLHVLSATSTGTLAMGSGGVGDSEDGETDED